MIPDEVLRVRQEESETQDASIRITTALSRRVERAIGGSEQRLPTPELIFWRGRDVLLNVNSAVAGSSATEIFEPTTYLLRSLPATDLPTEPAVEVTDDGRPRGIAFNAGWRN